jgi:glycosyltransferase involved in cell wall biosynthesis
VTEVGTELDQRVSCVVPAYNEADCLAHTLPELAAALTRLTREHEIIVVDDGSTDGTARVLAELAQRMPLHVVTHGANRGYAAALLSGFARASFPLVFFTDSDGQFIPDDLALLLARIDAADIVVGYRVGRCDPWPRLLLSHGFNAIVRALLDVELRDVNCAFKLMRREVLRTLVLEGPDFCISSELAAGARRAGLTVLEVGVRHRRRRAGRSSVRPWHLLTSIYGIAMLRRRLRRLPARPLVTPALGLAAVARRPAPARLDEGAR